jgi:A/G-specific adenine glycosylase
MSDRLFSRRLLAWYIRHGRQFLPWKLKPDPYRIWVSEIMLQQTQVKTVIPYFNRFIRRFPNVRALARAGPDEVMHLWTGLGYYARARNLHRAAQQIVAHHAGVFPRTFQAVADLPGIGRSTAGAILALAFGQRHSVLDGNVKRVLARYYAVDTPLNKSATEDRLWRLAEHHTPRRRVAEYTQAIMDLGATVCVRTRPRCTICPLHTSCRACRHGSPEVYPARVGARRAPLKTTQMLMILDRRGHVLLQRRPPVGLWGGLWGFPECIDDDARHWCRETLGLKVRTETPWPVLRHSFSHFRLDITPVPAHVLGEVDRLMENPETVWYNLNQPDRRGFSAPVERLLDQLRARQGLRANT